MNEIIILSDSVREAHETNNLVSHLHTVKDRMLSSAWELAEGLFILSKTLILEKDAVFEKWAALEYGMSDVVVRRYVSTWGMLLKAPDKVKISALEKQINTMIPLGVNIANGSISPDEVDWDKINRLETNGEVREYIREIKNIPERANTIRYEWTDGGDLIAHSNGERAFIGFLSRESDLPEFAKQAINRILHTIKGQ